MSPLQLLIISGMITLVFQSIGRRYIEMYSLEYSHEILPLWITIPTILSMTTFIIGLIWAVFKYL